MEVSVPAKRKAEDDVDFTTISVNVFKHLQLQRILRDDPKNKLITLHGKLPCKGNENSDAVVILEKLPFDKDSVVDCLVVDGRTQETLVNDIYSTHSVFLPRKVADCKATVICPATEKHIAKYGDHEAFIIRETPELYRTVTKPCLDSSKFNIKWVHNILEKKTESERIVFEDPDPEVGFILLPDMKWNRTDLDALYLVAIVHRCGINSLRDLCAAHIPLLRNILHKGTKAIKDQFDISSCKLRIYLHYQPSYNHLHVHFTHVKFDAPGSDCLRAHTLEDVIDNLVIDEEFYAKKTLLYVVRDGDELYKAYQTAGYFD